jgi:integrase/recombinase XerD
MMFHPRSCACFSPTSSPFDLAVWQPATSDWPLFTLWQDLSAFTAPSILPGVLKFAPFLLKTAEPTVGYLEKADMDAILELFNRRTPLGYRNYALLLFLYNTGARADEAAHVHVADLALGRSPSARIQGKGDKTRICPLLPHTAEILKPVVIARADDDCVFRNTRRTPLTRFGIYRLVREAGMNALSRNLTLRSRQISPHIIRHTMAVHLLRAGVDINTIRAWLGHVSVDTTNIYAEVDFEMKAKALAHCEIAAEKPSRPWRSDPTLMAFLKAL